MHTRLENTFALSTNSNGCEGLAAAGIDHSEIITGLNTSLWDTDNTGRVSWQSTYNAYNIGISVGTVCLYCTPDH